MSSAEQGGKAFGAEAENGGVMPELGVPDLEVRAGAARFDAVAFGASTASKETEVSGRKEFRCILSGHSVLDS
jgi:hypothetical protein